MGARQGEKEKEEEEGERGWRLRPPAALDGSCEGGSEGREVGGACS